MRQVLFIIFIALSLKVFATETVLLTEIVEATEDPAMSRNVPINVFTFPFTAPEIPQQVIAGSIDSIESDGPQGGVASPDLEILSIDATDGAYLPGSTVEVFFPMRNNGSIASGTSGRLRVYASTDSVITAADRELAGYVPDLDAGETINYVADVPIPVDLANGNYFIGAILEYPDPDQSNNTAVDTDTILISDEPEIHIQPLSLQLTESNTPAAVTSAGLELSANSMTYSLAQLPALIDTANNDGSVRVIVGFDTGSLAEGSLSEASKLNQRQAISTRGAALLDALQGMNYQQNARFEFIPYIGLTVDASTLQELAASPLVTSIELDRLSAPDLNSSNPVIGSAVAWADGFDGSDQTIAILDSGVDKSHPWFITGGNKVVTEACYSQNTANSTSACPGGVDESIASGAGVNCSNSVNGCDHGTHVAGIAAGNPGAGTLYGVARGANIAAMQVFSVFSDALSCKGGSAPCVLSFTSDQIKALERVYSLRNTFDFASVNMSLGGMQFFNSADCDAANPSRKAAIDNLRSVGIATIISSGNDGFVDSIGAPGCITSAVSVGNTTDADAVSSSSNIYPEIDLLAPGTSITSSVPGTGTGIKTGTSMAAPQVAGAWAVLKQANPGGSVDAILSALQLTGTPVDDLRNGGIETNMPRVNVDLALGDVSSSFSILNQGPVELNITSIARETTAPWVTWSPQAPFTVQPGELQVVSVAADFGNAPAGTTQTRLLVSSDDGDESPYPGAVLVNVTPLAVPGNIIVDKLTDPAGSSQSFDFTLTGTNVDQAFSLTHAATPYDSGVLLPTTVNGTYGVAESLPTGWTGSGICSDGSPASAVDLSAGETVTCTFTNTINSGFIIVDKVTIPGGSSQSFDFTLIGTGINQSFSLTDSATPYNSGALLPTSENGSYNVTETMPTGWTGSGVCSDGSLPSAVNLSPGETVTCIFTNVVSAGTIIVDKVTDPAGSSQSFNFTLTGNGENQNFALTDTATPYNSGTLLPTSEGGTYDVAESMPAGWTGSGTCSDGSSPSAIDLAPGETVTCTFTNTIESGTIIVDKVTDLAGSSQSFEFTLAGNGVDQSFSLADETAPHNSGGLLPSSENGTYNVSETLPPLWSNTDSSCSNGSTPDAIELAAGETVTCTFTNSKEQLEGIHADGFESQ